MDAKTEIRFYHLERSYVEQALPALLDKAYGQGKPILLQSGSDEKRLEQLDELLWNCHATSFLPHDIAGGDYDSNQPILVSRDNTKPANNAKVAILIDGSTRQDYENFDLVCFMFYGANENEVLKARQDWKILKDKDFHLTYWQQAESGGWAKKL
jgi:DNA polymerase III subunit chi